MSTTVSTQKAGRIDLNDIAIHLPGKVRFEAVRNITTTIAGGEFVSIIGPSGCGKSTLLNAVAGYLQPSSGRLRVDGKAVSGPGSDRGMVFQHHSLLPWRTALDNVAFGLKMSGVGRRERRERAEEFLQLVGLKGFSDRYPAQLSGGMQQRVEIARVLINNPRVVLMDEPFGALDAQTRERMQQLLLDIWGRLQPTVLFVWGPGRILPVRVTGLSITEKLYDEFLNPTHADGPAPLVEGVEHVFFAELDAHRTPACALGVVPIERAVDAVDGDLERNALLGPATHQLEGRAHDANQVSVVLARQVRLDGTAVLVGCHSQTTSPPTTRSVPVP